MTCYIVITAEPKPRYGNRNKLMVHYHNACIYSSPGSAKDTAKRLLTMHPDVPGVWVCVYNSERHPEVQPVLVTRAVSLDKLALMD